MPDHSLRGDSGAPGPRMGAGGVRFSVRAPHAGAVDLCLFSAEGEESRRAMAREEDGRWALEVGGLEPGQEYGFRADGPWDPVAGLRYNPAKLLLDPEALAIGGPIRWHPSLADAQVDGTRNAEDSAPHLPRSLLIDRSFDWQGDRLPGTPLRDSVIYECHVRGMTMQHPAVEPRLRGTFLGLAAPPVLEHLTSLGVTALELLPVMHVGDDPRLHRLGLVNYWGYATAGYLAPDSRLATGQRGEQVAEFKEMVRRLHLAGLEVILDIVFNHTAEVGLDGPTLAWRGLDNRGWYLAEPGHPGRYVDVTGCGHTLDCVGEPGWELLTRTLRYWATEMHVDGFRFDLAPALARGGPFPESLSSYFTRLRELPDLSHMKLIAEPWDLGSDGYQLGRFPAGWSEWNDRYRDTVRRYWRGDGRMTGALATALAGSSDRFGGSGRPPHASVNYVASHDGFTLADLVRYERRHNEQNGEGNRDGHAENWSRNWGAEGPSSDPAIEAVRMRCARSLIATVLLSQGLPMLGHGDELGRTQHGNNNAYCQDGPLTWIDWKLTPEQGSMVHFVAGAVALRRRHETLRRLTFLGDGAAGGPPDAEWFREDGARMTTADWHDEARHGLGLLLRHGGDAQLVMVFNGGAEDLAFTLPAGEWSVALDTCDPSGAGRVVAGSCPAPAGALVVLEAPHGHA